MIAPRHRSTTAHNRQRRERRVILLVALAAALVLAAGFYLGQRVAYGGMGIEPESYRNMQLELPLARDQVKALGAELKVQRTLNEVDRRALEIVRRDLAAQKERIADLEEGLLFYRSLMAPGDITHGLSLREIEIVEREEPGRYAYRIVVQQEALKHELIRGQLTVEVLGLLDGEQVGYPLAELADDVVEEAALALRFRYFQAIEGELLLPAGFEPRVVSVSAVIKTPIKADVGERFPWQVQEKFTHVGK